MQHIIPLSYYYVFIYLFFSILLSWLLLRLSITIIPIRPDSEKLAAYECGFDPYNDARNTFDVRFYLVALLFIVFDIEAALLFPWFVTLSVHTSYTFWLFMDFMVELIIGYIYVWKLGGLDWD